MNVPDIVSRFPELSVLVVGDICLDRWCWYDPAVAQASVETGIPRTGVVRTAVTPGAGGTVANNLAALGAGTINVLGAIGKDGFGWELTRALSERRISTELLISSNEICTFTYTKLINSETDEEDLPRVDFINTRAIPPSVEQEVLLALERHWSIFNVVIVADQAETEDGGVVTAAVREKVIELARRSPETVVWVDSRRRPELFSDVVLKPNQSEAEEASRRKFGAVDFDRLAKECHLPLLIVTHGEKGALVIENGQRSWVQTRRVTPVDICGAGDSFTAGAACALKVSGSALDAARIGNLVASITVTKKGTGTASPAELVAASAETIPA